MLITINKIKMISHCGGGGVTVQLTPHLKLNKVDKMLKCNLLQNNQMFYNKFMKTFWADIWCVHGFLFV